MALPKINTPTYEMELPSTGETIKYRPFLVKEQKLLLIAQETGEEKDVANAMGELVQSCTFGKIDSKLAPLFDVEYLFLKIRGKSVGDVLQLNLTCPDDNKTQVVHKLNIEDISVNMLDDHTNEIQLLDNCKIVFRYPILSDMSGISNTNDVNTIFNLMESCVQEIHYGDDVYQRSDMKDKDITDFIDQLTGEQFERITEFFNSMPKLRHVLNIKNPKTKKESEVVLEGLQSFFRIGLSHESLGNYFKTNFALMQHHKYSLTELENMMPWEREIYLGLLMEWIEEENRKIEQEKQKQNQ